LLDTTQFPLRHTGIVLESHGGQRALRAVGANHTSERDDGADIRAAVEEGTSFGADFEILALHTDRHVSPP
jgi:hypothetical protein